MEKQDLRSNFKTAFQEIINGKTKEDDDSGVLKSGAVSEPGSALSQEQKPTELYTAPAQNPTTKPTERTKSVIAEDMEIVGSIAAGGDLDVYGSVKGDIFVSGKVFISGTVFGNIECDQARVECGQVAGQTLKATRSISIETNAAVKADVEAVSIEVSGSLSGTICASEGVVLNTTSLIKGDITAKFITAQKGASITGLMKIVNE